MSNYILAGSLHNPIADVKTLLMIEYNLSGHFKSRMKGRNVNMADLNRAIESGIIESAKDGRMKQTYKGLTLVYVIEGCIETLITCYHRGYSFKKA